MAQRRTRLLDLRAPGPTIFAWCEQQRCGSAFATRWSPASRPTASRAMRGSRRSIRPARASSTDQLDEHRAPSDALHQHPQRRPPRDCSARPSRAASRRTADCTFPRHFRTSRRISSKATPSCRRSARGCWRRSRPATRWRPSCRAICREAFDFPAPLVRAAECAGAGVGARAVSRPDRRVQGFRRALPRRMPWSASAAAQRRKLTILVATSATPAARSRRRFTAGRGSTSSCCIRRAWSRERQAQQLACWGGNVRTFAVRGTFDDCQRMVKEAFARPGARRDASAVVGQQHQRRPPAAADGVLRQGGPGAVARDRPARRTSSCRPAISAMRSPACGRVTSACRSARSCSRPTRIRPITEFLRTGEWAPRAERRHAGFGDGRRQSEQHGAPARAASRTSKSCRGRSAHRASMTSRSAARSAATRTSSAGCGVRTRRPRPRCSAGCWRAARAVIG